MELFTVIAYKVNIFTTSAALPDEKQLFYAEAKYNSGIVIAREICGPFTRHRRASRARSVQKLHCQYDLSQKWLEHTQRRQSAQRNSATILALFTLHWQRL
ncbi:hypothetical protein GNG27_09900 [Leclercia sp. 119287]|nr:hypothetical protein [Leclercia sp. 119287]QGU14957.1 hypothetical protein GNG27_09900 [Leclercia sp. 119287]